MNHTVSLKLSTQLKEKGFEISNRQFNLWWYKFNDEILCGDRTLIEEMNAEFDGIQPELWICEAYLLSEVLEQLPPKSISLNNFDKHWDCEYCEDDIILYQTDINPCDAAAKLWLQLIDEGIITFNKEV